MNIIDWFAENPYISFAVLALIFCIVYSSKNGKGGGGGGDSHTPSA